MGADGTQDISVYHKPAVCGLPMSDATRAARLTRRRGPAYTQRWQAARISRAHPLNHRRTVKVETVPHHNPNPPEPAADAGMRRLVVGTRGSELALHQARHVAGLLAAAHPGIDVAIEVISSEGDVDKNSPLTQIGGRGVFTSSLQRALGSGAIDAAVHSSKDVPSLSATGLALAAFPQREDPRDVVVSWHGVGLADLPASPVVGTSSRRRAAQVLALRPDAVIADLRGNIDTRLKKAASDRYDAIILAAAGLTRMGWLDRATELLPIERFTPAPGQGALAVETREAPDSAFTLAGAIDHARIRQALEIERAFLRGSGGGCTTPLGAHASVEIFHGQAVARFWGMLARDDGSALERVYEEWPVERAPEAAFDVARRLVAEVRPNRIFGAAGVPGKQLEGMKVIVTGTDTLIERLTGEVERRGGEPVPVEAIRIAPPEDPQPLADAVEALRGGRFDWVVLTSRQGVAAMADALRKMPGDTKTAVIGEATGAALREIDVDPAVVAATPTGEGLVAALAGMTSVGDRVLLPVSSRARDVVDQGLAALGADVTRVDAYATEIVSEPSPEVVPLVERGEIGAVLLASPSAVRGFLAQYGALLPALSAAAFVAIGPVTAAAMRTSGLPVHAMADPPGAAGMVEALDAYLWGERAEGSDS
jgi:hydroxymethylbilane synthase